MVYVRMSWVKSHMISAVDGGMPRHQVILISCSMVLRMKSVADEQ